jgi:sugar diacid utilization regulator
MALTVREIRELKEFKNFKLVAGRSGLDNRIDAIGFLDYEFVVDDPSCIFHRNDFVISSLLFAKDKPELLLTAIRKLCEDRVGALAVKNVCYEELPQDVLDYANEHRLPIFMFGRNDAFYENIAVCLKNKITEKNNQDIFEEKISSFLKNELTMNEQRKLLRELLPNPSQYYQAIFCLSEKEEKRKNNTYYQYFAHGEKNHSQFYYKGGCFFILFFKKNGNDSDDVRKSEISRLLQDCLIGSREDYITGFGEVHSNPEELDYAIREAIYAERYSDIFSIHSSSFSDIGIWQLLFPNYRTPWYQYFRDNLLDKIRAMDSQHDTDFYKTAEEYVRCKGNISQVSESMHLHKNTVRYRINKIKETLNMQDELFFEQQLYMAFYINLLEQRYQNDEF